MGHSSVFHGHLWVIESKYKHEEKWRPLKCLNCYSRREAIERVKNLNKGWPGQQFRVVLYQKVPGRS